MFDSPRAHQVASVRRRGLVPVDVQVPVVPPPSFATQVLGKMLMRQAMFEQAIPATHCRTHFAAAALTPVRSFTYTTGPQTGEGTAPTE